MKKLSVKGIDHQNRVGKFCDGNGLMLWVRPRALGVHKVWLVRYTSPVHNRRQDMRLGAYPKVGLMQARAETVAIRSMLNSGIDHATRVLRTTPDFLITCVSSAFANFKYQTLI